MTGPLYLLIPGSALYHEQNLITILNLPAVVIYQLHTVWAGKHSRWKAIKHTEIRYDGYDNNVGVCVCVYTPGFPKTELLQPVDLVK